MYFPKQITTAPRGSKYRCILSTGKTVYCFWKDSQVGVFTISLMKRGRKLDVVTFNPWHYVSEWFVVSIYEDFYGIASKRPFWSCLMNCNFLFLYKKILFFVCYAKNYFLLSFSALLQYSCADLPLSLYLGNFVHFLL